MNPVTDTPLGSRSDAPAATSSAVVGMVGAGQLARMTLPAAVKLGIELRVLGRDPGDPAAMAATDFAEPDDFEALERFAAGCDVLTFDHEGVPTEHLEALQDRGDRVMPPPDALAMAQDKLHARRRFQSLGVPQPGFTPVATPAEAEAAAARFGWPLVLKARRGGYDGRGIVFASNQAEVEPVLAEPGAEWIAEPLVDIDCEVSQLLARSSTGEIALYPLVRTIQDQGICVETRFPAAVEPELERRAGELAAEIATAIGAVGIVAVELFVSKGELLVNELALRPHNTGHWTCLLYTSDAADE